MSGLLRKTVMWQMISLGLLLATSASATPFGGAGNLVSGPMAALSGERSPLLGLGVGTDPARLTGGILNGLASGGAAMTSNLGLSTSLGTSGSVGGALSSLTNGLANAATSTVGQVVNTATQVAGGLLSSPLRIGLNLGSGLGVGGALGAASNAASGVLGMTNGIVGASGLGRLANAVAPAAVRDADPGTGLELGLAGVASGGSSLSGISSDIGLAGNIGASLADTGLGYSSGLGSIANDVARGSMVGRQLASGAALGALASQADGPTGVGLMRGVSASAAAAAAAAGGNGLGLGSGLGAGLVSPALALDAAVASESSGELARGAALADSSSSPALGRAGLAADALANAEAESAIAGADMAAHGANNARSAALASNAYRQAKLASARDRVNVAGTIQNSARISDAAIATHDAATKAEDSLLGSELAVDSAATVLDSDAAYIPPVTNSLLRSLPYGRLSLRNILPKPLTYPSVLLPDVWLNGAPVNYQTLPFRMLPGYGPNGAAALGLGLGFGGVRFANGQTLIQNNGILLNDLVFDPTLAYYLNPNVYGSSIYPILINGQLEAMDEVSAANWIANQQRAATGKSTFDGFGQSNLVPMLTGSVTEANFIPTTTMGTTYPIGSALVIEPRDSYFQDYVDNASSRQNFDERSQ